MLEKEPELTEEMIAQKFQPIYDNVVLLPIVEKARGGIEIPKMAQEKILIRAKVLAVGPGKYDVQNLRFVPTVFKPGDIVYINSYIGMKLKADIRTELVIQKEDEIRIREMPLTGSTVPTTEGAVAYKDVQGV